MDEQTCDLFAVQLQLVVEVTVGNRYEIEYVTNGQRSGDIRIGLD